MVLLRSALRSTAFGRRLPSGGPSVPLPQAYVLEPNTARPGSWGALACGWVGALLGFAVGLFLPEDYRLTLHDGSIEPDTGAPMLRGRWRDSGNDLSAQAQAERAVGV